MARPRGQTYTLKMYLSKIKDGDIDNSADVQRNFVWKSEQINEFHVAMNTNQKAFVYISNFARYFRKILNRSFIWLALFHRFTDLGAADSRFAEFLREFMHGLRNKAVGEKRFDTVGSGAGTKDKAVIIAKLQILETLMMEFLQINKKDLEEVDVLRFIQKNINPEAEKEDVELYEEMCRDYFIEAEEHSNMLAACNRPSMIMLAAYACEAEQDASIKNWIVDFDRRNTVYIRNPERTIYI